MKKLFIPVLTGLGLCSMLLGANAQEVKEHISQQFSLQKGLVAIYNVFGNIKVEGYSGDKIIIEVDETIRAGDQASLDQGKKELKLGFDHKGDSVVVYIAEPFDSRPGHKWRYEKENGRMGYHYDLEYVVKVPFQMSVTASTVNNGGISVKDVYGALQITNVNGGIEISNARGITDAHTINGPLTVTYLSNPPGPSSYYTLNGRLDVTYAADLAADLEFKSMNGHFYTDFPEAAVMPARATVTKNKNEEGTSYRLSKNHDVRIGGGGRLLKFETLNGNIYIRKAKT